MHAAAASDGLATGRASLRLAAFEVAWIFLIFFLYAGSPPPDAGESHYLVKAKHYWDPAWCAGDLFLESSDTHLGFYWTLGWLTRLFSLDTTTWILRGIIWGLLAWSWRRLSWAVVPRPLFSLLTAGLMLLLAQHFHWSKELLLRGGVEGKTIAYVGVFLALEAIVQNRWRAALLWSGAAGALHVLVGGWTAVAIGLAWLTAGKERPPLPSLAPAAFGGLVLSLPGLIPSLLLLQPSDPRAATEAWRIYVFERLPHHLVFHRFPWWYQLRHAALAAVWAWLTWSYWRDTGIRRLMLAIGGTVAIGLAGIVIDQCFVVWSNLRGISGDEYQLAAAPLLRFYWFRVEDALLPVGVALAIGLWLMRLRATRPAWGESLTAVAIVAVSVNLAEGCYWRSRLRVPGAVLQQQATPDTRLNWWWEHAPGDERGAKINVGVLTLSAKEHYAYWQHACRWIAANTPADAKFITPRLQQTFKWNAGRAEVATRKDLPQDPASILVWRDALAEVYPSTAAHHRYDLEAFSDEELVHLAQKYGCQFIIVERRWPVRNIRLPQVYPQFREENPVFQVYRVPESKGDM